MDLTELHGESIFLAPATGPMQKPRALPWLRGPRLEDDGQWHLARGPRHMGVTWVL